MRLLITWAQDCPPAVDALLMPAGRIPMLLDLTQHKYVLTSLLLLIFLGDMAHTSSVARSRVLDVGMLSPDLLISAYTGRGTGGESVQTMKDGRVLFISSCNAPSPLRLEKRVIVISGEEAFRHFKVATRGNYTCAACRFGARQVACTGLAAVLLGVCLLHSAPTQPADSQQERVTTAVLSDIISSRTGLAAFFGLLDALKQDPQFVQAASGPAASRPTARGGQARDEGTCS